MKLVLGTVQFGLNYGINNSAGKISQNNVFSILDNAYVLNVKELDTADVYGNSADVLASYLSHNPQKKIKIMSKFVKQENISIEQSFNESCSRLGVKSLEGYYFHRFEDFKRCDDFEVFSRLKNEGRLGKLGVSLYLNSELALAVESKEVDVIQLPFNILDCSKEKVDLLKKAKANGKIIYVRSIFLQGLFFKDLSTLTVKLKPLEANLAQLQKIVKDYNVSMEEFCLKFTTEQAFIDKVVIGVDTSMQLEKNVRSLDQALPNGLIKDALSIKVENQELLNPVNWT